MFNEDETSEPVSGQASQYPGSDFALASVTARLIVLQLVVLGHAVRHSDLALAALVARVGKGRVHLNGRSRQATSPASWKTQKLTFSVCGKARLIESRQLTNPRHALGIQDSLPECREGMIKRRNERERQF